MLARVISCSVIGLEGVSIEVEVDISRAQNPNTTIVGLPDAAVQEARERVRAAIRNSGLTWPFNSRITANLAPADIRKEGPSFDLPIAVGVLKANDEITGSTEGAMFVGELALNGEVRPVHGILPMVAHAVATGLTTAFVPEANAAEAALVDGIEAVPVASLQQLVNHLNGVSRIAPATGDGTSVAPPYEGTDFADVAGQEHAKRALEVAAAGGHNVIMRGPPGSGKTLLARSMPSILPPMNTDEALEVTRIYSVAHLLGHHAGLMATRPFRAPHHTISNAGLVGGGSVPRPGEITLAHRGILFLDELPEFDPRVLEVLRQPLEDRTVTISRARHAVTFPASFTLVAAANPCPCGYSGDPQRQCTCAPSAVNRYQRRVSGPLLDRIDLFIDVARVDYEKLTGSHRAESSADVATRVAAGRSVQHERFRASRRGSTLNADMHASDVRAFAQEALTDGAQALLGTAVRRLALSARAYHRVLKVSRTIADLEHSDAIEQAHVAEALQYRARGE